MFSQLGPLFKTVFRNAEAADARLEIRREEKEDGRKKNDDETVEDNTDALWEDSTSVSVQALRAFLIEFLKGHGASVPETAATEASQETLPLIETPAPSIPVSTEAARAIKAYSSMAGQNHPVPPPLPPSPPKAEETDLASLLESDEIRTIHRLIEDLDLLARRGVETLSFQMNGTFLESVSEAVRLQKAQF